MLLGSVFGGGVTANSSECQNVFTEFIAWVVVAAVAGGLEGPVN